MTKNSGAFGCDPRLSPLLKFREFGVFFEPLHRLLGRRQNQFDALSSLVFNIGEGGFSSSTLLRLLNSKDYEGAANQFPRWNKQKGRVLNGLTKRRQEERQLFLKKG